MYQDSSYGFDEVPAGVAVAAGGPTEESDISLKSMGDCGGLAEVERSRTDLKLNFAFHMHAANPARCESPVSHHQLFKHTAILIPTVSHAQLYLINSQDEEASNDSHQARSAQSVHASAVLRPAPFLTACRHELHRP